MKNEEKERLKIDKLKKIIEDSVIIDIDMTKWNKHISLIVISDHLMSDFSFNKNAIFEIKFISVSKFETIFPCNIDEDDIFENTVWRTHRFQLTNKKENTEITIFQMEDMPKITILFKKIEIKELSYDLIMKTFPNLYNSMNSYFIRPNIETIFTSYNIKKR
jgi:hypothetical protein